MVIKISVRNLVEFILRSGSIDNRQTTGMQAEAMQRGSRMHRRLQKLAGSAYQAEVPLKMEFVEEHYTIILEGRADGLIVSEQFDFNGQDQTEKICAVTIDEIKGVFFDISQMTEPVSVHLAQAKCYAFIYAVQNHVQEIGVRMTYANLDTEEVRYFYIRYAFDKLEHWFLSLMQEYKKWAQFQYEQHKIRQHSIKMLEFPFPYRKGQKDLVSGVYRTILRQKNLFIQAPTGTGKTISTLFPALKAVGEGYGDKIFYLTAKTITAAVAKETLDIFYAQGYRAKTVQITAKEKLCMMEETTCNPDACPYAKGHFDRVNDAVFQLLQQADMFTRELIIEQAQKHMVCPFELCLDTASWVDNIICDYNYVFDPKVYLKRFFADGQKGDYIFLIDEAHNLVERGREMYSAQIYKEDLLAVRKWIGQRDPALTKALTKSNRLFLELKRECDAYRIYKEDFSSLIFTLLRLAERMDYFLQRATEFPEKKEIVEFYFSLRTFLAVHEALDERYVAYTEHGEDGRFRLRLFCVDPSRRIQDCLDKGRAAILFSATLLPVQYYKEMLSVKADNYAVYAQTSFSEDQHLLCIGRDVSARYSRRNAEEFQKIASYILEIVSAKKGNYMAFFPSYHLLGQVYDAFLPMAPKGLRTLAQKSGMKEEEREAFLHAFEAKEETSLAAFCVLGGIFGEGIDLKEERLIGVMIVGTGLPQICNEREILKEYFDRKTGAGFDYAYRYPAMNKVLQAAGRVIRTANDRGIIALLDGRFLEGSYKRLFPREWKELSAGDSGKVISGFWEQF